MAHWRIDQTVDMTTGEGSSIEVTKPLLLPGDNVGHTWKVVVLDNGAAASLDGYTAAGYFRRVGGTIVVCNGTISGNAISVKLSKACYALPGPLQGWVRISRNGAYSFSTPPLKKNVTCAYFSVSAILNCLYPNLLIYSPNVFVNCCGKNATFTLGIVLSYCVIQT